MRLPLSIVASSAAVVLASVVLSGPAVSQISPGPATAIPDVTVDVPKQAAKPSRANQAANIGVGRRAARTSSAPVATAQTQPSAPAAPTGSVEERLARIEMKSSSCAGGCETSFKSGNAPWVGCAQSGQEPSHFDTTCTDTLIFKDYADCTDTKAFLGLDRNKIWLHCTSLLAGGKFKVAELKRLKRSH
ncbi:hypothetical protein [Bradyrhizobium sp. STM 3809]|uniref:hypothetical protein n=1 Tax=Bradyrhizobium sp. STM 3809 TaxID=551936 RepID=UPI000553462B|nr:hypothetical protein [Bradyrhizobium sp. STM 3809]